MPQIYITQSVGRNVVAGTIRRWPRTTIDRISSEVGRSDWYEEPMPHPKRRRFEEDRKSSRKRKREVEKA